MHECKKDSGSGVVSVLRSADFQVCRAVDFPTRRPQLREAGLEVGNAAGLETCVTDLDRVKAGQNEKIMPIRLIDKF